MNLVLVVIDTLRADALAPEAADGGALRMPSLSALAARGVSFRNAAAPASWTLPSMTSLLTGLLPSAHGLLEADLNSPLVPAIVTYAEVLKEPLRVPDRRLRGRALVPGPRGRPSSRDSRTGTCGSVSRGAGRGWRRGAARGVRSGRSSSCSIPSRPTPRTAPRATRGRRRIPARRLPRLRSRSAPDSPPADIVRVIYLDETSARGVRTAFGADVVRDIVQRYEFEGFAADPDPALAADLEAAYWDGVKWVDGLLGRTLGLLDRLGLLENTLLVVTSDHGETFGAHGALGHGRLLYDDLLRIPLVMLGPEPFRGGRVLEGSSASWTSCRRSSTWRASFPRTGPTAARRARSSGARPLAVPCSPRNSSTGRTPGRTWTGSASPRARRRGNTS